MKNTPARTLIHEFLEKSERPLTALDIYKKLEGRGINLSTVYRTLATFESEGLIKKETSPYSKESAYVWLEEGHHTHILECTKCHKQIELDYCPFEEVERETARKHGFILEDENRVLYGVCKDCQDK